MSILQRVVKPTTRKGKKVLIKREPQVLEGPKTAIFLKGRKCSEKIRMVLKDLYQLKKPDAQMLNRKNDVTVFEDATPVEVLCKRHEAGLFVLGSHSKKRPDNVVLGRTFNYNVLDMVEMNVEVYESLQSFNNSKILMGSKPCLIFNGPHWEQNEEFKHLKSILIDFFHREHVEQLRLQGIEHSISFTVGEDGKVLIRSYKVLLKKSGSRTPRIELEEIGPRLDLTLRRSKLPSEDLMKEALRQPRELKVTKKKNISTDPLGTTHGRVHMGNQNIQKIQTRKMKGLKKTPQEKKTERQARKRSLQTESKPNIAKKQKSSS